MVVAGAELFTGNNLLVMAWVPKRITTARLLRNFAVVYLANLVGAAGLAGMVWLSGHAGMNEGEVGLAAVKIAAGKTASRFSNAFEQEQTEIRLLCFLRYLLFRFGNSGQSTLRVVLEPSICVSLGVRGRIGGYLDDSAGIS